MAADCKTRRRLLEAERSYRPEVRSRNARVFQKTCLSAQWRGPRPSLAGHCSRPSLVAVSDVAGAGVWEEFVRQGGFDVLQRPLNATTVLSAAGSRLHPLEKRVDATRRAIEGAARFRLRVPLRPTLHFLECLRDTA